MPKLNRKNKKNKTRLLPPPALNLTQKPEEMNQVTFQLQPDNALPLRQPHVMRAPCPHCGHGRGYIEVRGGQRCVFCTRCGRWCYNAPKSEIGSAQLMQGE